MVYFKEKVYCLSLKVFFFFLNFTYNCMLGKISYFSTRHCDRNLNTSSAFTTAKRKPKQKKPLKTPQQLARTSWYKIFPVCPKIVVLLHHPLFIIIIIGTIYGALIMCQAQCKALYIHCLISSSWSPWHAYSYLHLKEKKAKLREVDSLI